MQQAGANSNEFLTKMQVKCEGGELLCCREYRDVGAKRAQRISTSLELWKRNDNSISIYTEPTQVLVSYKLSASCACTQLSKREADSHCHEEAKATCMHTTFDSSFPCDMPHCSRSWSAGREGTQSLCVQMPHHFFRNNDFKLHCSSLADSELASLVLES